MRVVNGCAMYAAIWLGDQALIAFSIQEIMVQRILTTSVGNLRSSEPEAKHALIIKLDHPVRADHTSGSRSLCYQICDYLIG